MSFFDTQNPGIGGLDELTTAEELVVQQIASLGDPGADRLLFWDESANSYAFLTAGSGLTITGTTITASGSGGVSIGDTITSATEGSVLFAGASGVLAQNNASFYWDNTGKELSINSADGSGPALWAGRPSTDFPSGIATRSAEAGAVFSSTKALNAGNNIGAIAIGLGSTTPIGFIAYGVNYSDHAAFGFGGEVYDYGTDNSEGLIAGWTYCQHNSTGVADSTTGYYVYPTTKGVGAGTITLNYGVYVDDQDGVATTNYGFYQAGAGDLNYFAGNTGIGNANPSIPLQIGANAIDAPDGAVYITRSVTGTANAHGFGDETAVNLTGSGSSVNSFDAAPTITAIGATGAHYAGYQFRPILSQSTTLEQVRGYHFSGATELNGGGTVTEMYGFLSSGVTLTSGTVTNYYGFYQGNVTGPTNVYGLYLGGSPTNLMGSGFTGFGTTTPTAKIHMAGSVSAAAWTTAGIAIRQAAATYTDTSSSGTVAANYVNSISNATLAASSATTYTAAASWWIGNAPTAGSNVTITNSFSLIVTQNSRLGGYVAIGSNVAPTSQLQIGTNQSAASWTTQGLQFHVGGQTLTDTTGSGTIASRVASSYHAPALAASSAVTVTRAATLYIEGAPTAGSNTTLTNTHAFWVDSGSSRFEGDIDVATVTGGIATLTRVDTSVTANDMVGKIQFYAADTSTTSNFIVANIEAQATNTITTDINPGRLIFRTTPTGVAATPTEALRISEAQQVMFSGAAVPFTSDLVALGSSTLQWSDLFLAEGAVINFDNGDVTVTQTGNVLAVAGGDLRVATADVGTNADSVPTLSSTSTFTNKTLTSPTVTTATLSGAQQLAEGASIRLDQTLSADGTFSGVTIAGTAGATLAFGDVIYLAAADSRWELADASAASTSGSVLIGMCVLAAAADADPTVILLQGNIRADTAFPALTISAPVYISETAGDVTNTAPTTTDSVTRVLGFALTADSMYFNPSGDYITHV